ncbi:MAG TPA: DNA repair exonuclease [Pseudomonadales bacterium]|nr:DNA repair exonuclease [Pseudomonadales bacterium]HND13487.1 DNA repair exonuclease [Pseudomonadales bacterium]
MPRFLHTADWQIGRRYSTFAAEDAAALFEARFAAIRRIGELAASEQVDAVLVAGDVFDSQFIANRDLHRAFQAMEAFKGPWLLIPGNHDAALAESVWTRAARVDALPANVHVFATPGVYPFEEQGFVALAAPLTQRHTHDDLTDWFDRGDTPAGLLRIGLAHGSVSDVLMEAADSANPIAADRARRARLDYLALGDWHGTKRIDSRTWYSGTPEQERFKDNDPGNVLLVDIASPGAEPEVSVHRVGAHRWIRLERTFSVPSDLDLLLQELGDLDENAVIDLSVSGQLDLVDHERFTRTVEPLAARHRSFVVHDERLRLVPDDEDIATLGADGYVGEVIATLREQQKEDSEGAAIARDALAILTALLREHRAEAGR